MGYSRASKNVIYRAMGKMKLVAGGMKKKMMTDDHSKEYERVGSQLHKKQAKK